MKAPQRLLPFLTASFLACSIASAQFQGTYTAPVNLPIPPSGSGGAVGGCTTPSPNTTEFALSVPDAFVLSHVRLELTLTHTYVGDLTLMLKHCGTNVVLYDRSPSSPANLSGMYAFDDQASLVFANYVTTQPVVPPNTYLPVNSLAPFLGMSSAGDWTISICDQASGDVGQLTGMTLVLSGAETYGGWLLPTAGIPDGFNGCTNPVARAINVSANGVVDTLAVALGFDHPNVRDLQVTISHDGVAVTLISQFTVKSGVGVQGLYTFKDGLASSFVAAGNAAAVGSDVPTGTYTPASPLSAFIGHPKQGIWMVTVCDCLSGNVGSLTNTSITLSNSAWDLTLIQPIGAGSLMFSNTGGSPGNTFLNLATAVAGSFPNGWLFGLDISISEIVFEIGVGAPFTGTLGSCGAALTWIIGPIPSNVPVQFVSFELDASGTPISAKKAFQYVTQ